MDVTPINSVDPNKVKQIRKRSKGTKSPSMTNLEQKLKDQNWDEVNHTTNLIKPTDKSNIKRNKKHNITEVDVVDPALAKIAKNKKDQQEILAEHKLLSKGEYKKMKHEKKRKKYLVEAEHDNVSDWVKKPVSGIDLVSKEPIVTEDGKYIVINSQNKVLIYSSKSSQLVRQLNTGNIIAVQKGDVEGEIRVASKTKIMTWNFMEVKIVEKFALADSKFKHSDILDIFIPEKFGQSKEVFISVQGMDKMVALFRLNVVTNICNKIFNNHKIGSVHIGEKDNLVCAISDHKEYGFKDCTLLAYDRNLSKNMSVNTDKARPFTCVKVHPVSKVIACGDTSGRVLVYSGLEQPEPVKAVMHWHSLPVGGIAWSGEGGVLYSGGGEAVLAKWKQEDGSKPSFVPRVGGAIVGVGGGSGITVLQLDSNRLVVVDRMTDIVVGLAGGLARNKSGWPAGLVRDREKLVMNGGVGLVQVYNTTTGQAHSVDITQQTHLTKERSIVPHNSEVERLAVSSCGQYLATVDCLRASISRTILKLWTWDQVVGNYCLNTQVDSPHMFGVISLAYEPSQGSIPPMLLSVGGDSKVKLWQLGSNWSCDSCLTFRQLPAFAGGWSADGTLLGVSFQHIVTLWDKQSNLRTTLAVEDSIEPITSLVFGTSSSSLRHLYTITSTKMVVWDLLTLSPEWTMSITPSLHTTLCLSPTSPHMAVVQKDSIIIISPSTKSVISTFTNTNCTGGAAWVPNKTSGSSLYFLSYSGKLSKIGPPTNIVINTPIQPTENIFQSILSKGGVVKQDMSSTPQYTRARTMHDIEALLALPLHTVPPPSQLRTTIVRNRLVALPKLRRGKVVEKVNVEEDEKKVKQIKKIENVCKFDLKETDPLDLKSFCKLLKKSSL